MSKTRMVIGIVFKVTGFVLGVVCALVFGIDAVSHGKWSRMAMVGFLLCSALFVMGESIAPDSKYPL